jgi:predicted component of type VI protein secretion system
MPARLVPLTDGAAPIITLQRPVVLIGRHPECDVRIDLPQISRRHCCVALAYERLMIRDLGSRNGVRLNGRQVEEATLRPGDEVAIGQIIFRLEDTPAAPTPGPLPAKPAAKPSKPSKPPSIPELPDDLDGLNLDLIPLDD